MVHAAAQDCDGPRQIEGSCGSLRYCRPSSSALSRTSSTVPERQGKAATSSIERPWASEFFRSHRSISDQGSPSFVSTYLAVSFIATSYGNPVAGMPRRGSVALRLHE